jgi:hypothetical protein
MHTLAKKGDVCGLKRVFLICLAFLTVWISGCAKQDMTAAQMLENILINHPELPTGEVIYQSGAYPGQREYMTERLQSLLYDEGRMRNLPEFACVRDYAVNLSDGQYGVELHVFHMKSSADARDMEKLLTRRMKMLKRRSLYLYAPRVFEEYLSSSIVTVEGEYVFFLSTGKNEQILKELKAML